MPEDQPLVFLRDKRGVFTTIDVPGAEQTGAVEINNRGQIVGAYIDAGGTDPVFLRGKGVTKINASGADDNLTACVREGPSAAPLIDLMLLGQL